MRGKTIIRRVSLMIAAVFAITRYPALSQDDTLRINLNNAEERLIKNSLVLLAQHFKIDAGKALEIQTGLWDNPNLNISQNIYNQYTGKWFDFTSSGNTDIQVQQLFRLAGKRQKAVELAEADTKLNEAEYAQIARELKYHLRKDFFDLYYLFRSLDFYNKNISSVSKTADIVTKMNSQGTLILSEVIRIKALVFSLDNERNNILSQIHDTESDLHILLGDSAISDKTIIPEISDNILSERIPSTTVQDLFQKSLKARPDLQQAESQIAWERSNLALQQSLSVPDLSVGLLYTRNSSYIPDYTGISLGIDLPFFNRNQGNISYAETKLKGAETIKENMKIGIYNEIASAYRKAVDADSLYNKYKTEFTSDYDKMAENVSRNYQNRNITLIEYTDFFESYRTAMFQMNELAAKRLNAIEALNYAAGYDLIKY